MGKDSHFTGQPVYSQVIRLLDKEKIMRLSRETAGSEAYVKRFLTLSTIHPNQFSQSSDSMR